MDLSSLKILSEFTKEENTFKIKLTVKIGNGPYVKIPTK